MMKMPCLRTVDKTESGWPSTKLINKMERTTASTPNQPEIEPVFPIGAVYLLHGKVRSPSLWLLLNAAQNRRAKRFSACSWQAQTRQRRRQVLKNCPARAITSSATIPGLGTCMHPAYGGIGQIVCHENGSMAPNTTWTVRLTVKVTAPSGTVITENAAAMSDTPDPNLANTAAVSIKVQ